MGVLVSSSLPSSGLVVMQTEQSVFFCPALLVLSFLNISHPAKLTSLHIPRAPASCFLWLILLACVSPTSGTLKQIYTV